MTTFLIALAAAIVASLATWRLCKAHGVMDAILRESRTEQDEAQKSIRIYTDHALGRKFRQQRKDWADRAADAIEAMAGEDCPHRDRPSCPRCAQRRTVQAAAAVVREIGGIAP